MTLSSVSSLDQSPSVMERAAEQASTQIQKLADIDPFAPNVIPSPTADLMVVETARLETRTETEVFSLKALESAFSSAISAADLDFLKKHPDRPIFDFRPKCLSDLTTATKVKREEIALATGLMLRFQ